MCRVKSRSIYFTNMMCKRLLSVLVLSIVSKYPLYLMKVFYQNRPISYVGHAT